MENKLIAFMETLKNIERNEKKKDKSSVYL